ncbi:Bug family tripartite tricarboxylate transporter substrate binding protein [Muricoccus radiodurans]|uniref:Bug family tripartite tricarboxylate transporter substrate binding protein n=1 Tax=Muricoccus radiodurans TaxID=2231721 RepID=UPI003CF5C7C0
MSEITRRHLGGLALGAALAAPMGRVAAQATWPNRPVTVVVPFPPGGTPDVVGRTLARHLSESLGQPFVVENRTGAGGNIGASSVAKANPDGYTLLFSTNAPIANNTLLYRNMPYDPLTELVGTAPVVELPGLFTARPNLPFSNIQGMVTYARANPGKLNCGVPGTGLLGHLAAELLAHRTGARFTIVPYRGSAPLTNDLLGGAVDIAVDLVVTYLPHIRAGTVRPLGITAAQRMPTLPEIPTVAEQGVEGFKATGWATLLAPARTPPDIVQKLTTATNAFVQLDSTRNLLPTLGMIPLGGTSADVARLMQNEISLWGPIVREAGIVME